MAQRDLYDLLGPISPICGAKPEPSLGGSVSFHHHEEDGENAAPGFMQAQSRLQPRAPLGEASRHNAFDFGRAGSLKGGAAPGVFKPFGGLAAPRSAAAVLKPVAAPAPLPPRFGAGAAPALGTPASATATAAGTISSGGATPMSTSAGEPAATPASVGFAFNAPQSTTAPRSVALATPAATPAAAPPARASGARLTWGDVFAWRDPISSVLLFAGGIAAYQGAAWALAGGAALSPTSAVAYLLLAHLGLNFVRFFCSARWHAAAMWTGSAAADAWAERAVRAVRRLAAAHDACLSARDPHTTLAVALGLWALAWLGRVFSARQLLVAAYFAAFTLPPLYARHQAAADRAARAAYGATLGRLDRAEMPRTARLLALSGALVAMLVLTTWAQTAVAGLVAATYWRTTLAAADVDAIRTAAAPLTADVTRSVRKVRARLEGVLDEARALCSTAGPASRTLARTGRRHAA